MKLSVQIYYFVDCVLAKEHHFRYAALYDLGMSSCTCTGWPKKVSHYQIIKKLC